MKQNMARVLSVLFLVGFLLLAFTMLTRITPFEIQSLLPKNHALRSSYENYLKNFDDTKHTFILVHSTDGAFTEERLFQISQRLSGFLDKNPYVEDLISPDNAKYFSYEQHYFHLKKFFDSQKITTEGASKLNTEMWSKNLISKNNESFLISFQLSQLLPRKADEKLFREFYQFFDSIEQELGNIEIHTLGARVASAAFLTEMRFNLTVITPILLVLIGIFLYFLYRSWQILIWCFVIMFVCYLSTLMLIILFEGGLGPYSNFALMFSFIVATTDLIHFFSRYQVFKGTSEERLQQTLKAAYVPCLLTSLTTAAGFIALIINQNLPIRYFGFYCAFACMLEWVVIFYVLPKFLKIFNFNTLEQSSYSEKIITPYTRAIQLYAKPIIIVSLGILVIGAIAGTRLRIDDNFYTKFKDHHRLSKAVEAFSRHFQFIGSIDVIIEPTASMLQQKNSFGIVKEIEDKIKIHPQVSHLTSLRVIDDELQNEITSNSQPHMVNVKYSLLNFLNNYGVLTDFYNDEKNILKTTVFLKSLSTQDFNSVVEHINTIQSEYKNKLSFHIDGFASIRSHINNTVIKDFFYSFILSFFLTYLCFIYLYRNMKWGFIALLPNALPLLMIVGLMGWTQTSIDSNLAILICVAFGISGDNTIHLTYVTHQLGKKDEAYLTTLANAIRQIGSPIVATSAVFLFCLPAFMLGNLKLFNQMAIYLSVAFTTAFFADLFLFPSFHVLLRKKSNLRLPNPLPKS